MKAASGFYLLTLLVLGSGCGLLSAVDQPKVGSTNVAPIEQVLNGSLPLRAGLALTYKGITPGKSTRQDVQARWGNPNVVRRFGDYEVLHYFSGQSTKEYFLFKGDILQAVTSNVDEPTEIPDLHVYLAKEDQLMTGADVITPTLNSPPLAFPFPATRVLPAYGLAINTDSVYQFFLPTSLDEYRRLWGSYSLDTDPFPLIPSPDTVDIRPGETTIREVERLLGPPDRISSGTWLYDVEPDTLGRLLVLFGKDQVVSVMSVDQLRRRPTLAQVVAQYGTPDAVELVAVDGPEYNQQGLVYSERGLRVWAGCVVGTCQKVKRDTEVYGKSYVRAQPLEEFEKTWSGETFVPWLGFDE